MVSVDLETVELNIPSDVDQHKKETIFEGQIHLFVHKIDEN